MPAIRTITRTKPISPVGAGHARDHPVLTVVEIGGMPRSYSRIPLTCSPIASDAVNPGDSIPNKLTRPGTP
jgi:hypothetical protein